METENFPKHSHKHYIRLDAISSYEGIKANRANAIRAIPIQIFSLIIVTALCLMALLGLSIIAFDLVPEVPTNNQANLSVSSPF